MNIFYLSKDPAQAPKYLYNKHVVKMILETAQIICTAHQVLAEETGVDTDYIPYRKAYYNHPSCVWARQSKQNYNWLWRYFININMEYQRRYGKIHSSWTKCQHLENAPKGIADVAFTQPPQCMPDEYKENCAVQGYWNYYTHDKRHIAHKDESLWLFRPREIEQLNC